VKTKPKGLRTKDEEDNIKLETSELNAGARASSTAKIAA
jgi:hypothetical protein